MCALVRRYNVVEQERAISGGLNSDSSATSWRLTWAGRLAMLTNRRAFTLIELLVVISIIALLLAILLPSLSAAHQAGQSAVCMVNLDQIYTGAFLHAQDNEDYLPHFAYYASAHAGGGPIDKGEWWATQIARATANVEVGQ